MYRLAFILLAVWPGVLFCQQNPGLSASGSNPNQPGRLANTADPNSPKESKRLFFVVPNYRTSASLQKLCAAHSKAEN